jgi:hypothetical protein
VTVVGIDHVQLARRGSGWLANDAVSVHLGADEL